MGCGSSNLPATQPELRAPANPTQETRDEEPRVSPDPTNPTVENENETQDTVTSAGTGFNINIEPHKEFFPSISPSALELKSQMTVEKLAPHHKEESARREIEELIQHWNDCGQLADIESYSHSTPPSLTRSIPELSEFLTRNNANYVKAIEGNDLHIQVAKAYCIYSWIANNISYDRQLWQAYQFGDENSFEHSTQAENVLDRCMTVSKGYANLFYSLASKSGLMVEVIHGNIKGWKSQSPTRSKTAFKPSRENAHTWNLVSTSFYWQN